MGGVCTRIQVAMLPEVPIFIGFRARECVQSGPIIRRLPNRNGLLWARLNLSAAQILGVKDARQGEVKHA